ncbi:hypothetical protein PsalN5692_03951 (plasmid) [Piscirickettsia salmonis]|nr:hypothetical protein PsalN5692_00422 [Piscirickettsia salmonis]QGP50299.1 hypothetical protein PsalN5692_01761 [Piscirickettsia salmonis]QGP52442.1 hypothetical protein PsalN5692_03951 [Piscirickettsia salmonis]
MKKSKLSESKIVELLKRVEAGADAASHGVLSTG